MFLILGWMMMLAAGLGLAGNDRNPSDRVRRSVRRFGLGFGLVGGMLVAIGALLILFSGETWRHHGSWALPIGGLALKISVAEAFMLLLVQFVGCSIVGYLSDDGSGLDLGAFFVLLPALGICLAAEDVVLFLMAWEVMALCGVVWQRGRGSPEDRFEAHGLWAYLASAHLATACLLVALPMLAMEGGTRFQPGSSIVWTQAPIGLKGSTKVWVLIGLVLAGFGTKAGMFPFHPWVRTVYRNAPAHFGAASSGLMAKVSLFLLIRTLSQIVPVLGQERLPWLAGLMMILGMATGLSGLAGALTSARIKVVLGYSSVENVGIILIGYGIGLWGIGREAWMVSVFAFVGVWLHLINHMIAKTALFLSTGFVVRTTGTDDLARLGGLQKRLPQTAIAFGCGAMALSAMVPLNAFNSELLIYLGMFRGVLTLGPVGRDLSILAVAVMGLMGGLAAVCFTGVWGLGFLGNSRTSAARDAEESALSSKSRIVLKLLSTCILALGVAPILGFFLVRSVVAETMVTFGCPAGELEAAFGEVRHVLGFMSLVATILVILVAALKRWRDGRLVNSRVDSGMTWDCGFGYTDEFPRGQYGPLSYFEPLSPLIGKWTWQKTHRPEIREPFPKRLRVRIESADGMLLVLYEPVYRFFGRHLARLRWIQAGSIQLYLAMMAATLVIMLVWMMAV
jgi:formate hydrogenlyase subunit 3/multisubunit Na+/H+ antiporter MnhD subunit